MKDFCIGLYSRAILPAKTHLRKALRGEKGAVGIIEIALVLAVVIALAFLFKNKIKALFEKVMPTDANGIGNSFPP